MTYTTSFYFSSAREVTKAFGCKILVLEAAVPFVVETSRNGIDSGRKSPPFFVFASDRVELNAAFWRVLGVMGSGDQNRAVRSCPRGGWGVGTLAVPSVRNEPNRGIDIGL